MILSFQKILLKIDMKQTFELEQSIWNFGNGDFVIKNL